MKYITTIEDQKLTIEIDDHEKLIVDGQAVDYNFQPSPDPTLFSLLIGKKSYELRIVPEDEGFSVQLQGETLEVRVEDERTHRLARVKGKLSTGSREIIFTAPMPGLVIDMRLSEGDTVEAGQTLMILESMKMHNEFKAPRQAVVKEVPGTYTPEIKLGEQ